VRAVCGRVGQFRPPLSHCTLLGSSSICVIDELGERQYPGTQEFNACTAVHSTFKSFQPVDLSFGLAIALAFSQRVFDGGNISQQRGDRFNFGPPVGFPVQFRVVGSDVAEVRNIAYKVREIMRTNENVIDPHLNWNERMPSIRLDIDQDRARALGLTPQDVALTLQTLISGYSITNVRDGTEKVGSSP